MRKKILSSLMISVIVLIFCSCNGLRYIYSSSPLLSPVPSENGSTSVSAGYFTHNKSNENFDSLANRDKAFTFTASHMLGEKIMVAAALDLKKEESTFATITDSLVKLKYNGGFDSSFVNTKRYTAGVGIVYFLSSPGANRLVVPSIGGSLNLHHMQLSESGQLDNNPYHRFFDLYQVSLSLQYNILFKVSSKINLAYAGRLTLVKFFNPQTDFAPSERFNLALNAEGKIQLYPCLISGYASYKPFRNIPFYLESQFFNDFYLQLHQPVGFNLESSNIKGSGIAIGIKYVFR